MTRVANFCRVTLFAALALFAVAVPRAQAGGQFYFRLGVGVPVPVAPVAPVVVARPLVPPPYGYVWRPGFYNWTGITYSWVPAGWVRPPYARAVWVGPRWVRYPRGAYWARGHWRH
jgi:hypothetical protein